MILWPYKCSGRAMVQGISHRPLVPNTQIQYNRVHVRFVVDKLAMGQAFLRALHCSPVSFTSDPTHKALIHRRNTILATDFFLWRCNPTRVMASSFFRFLDHTQQRTTVGRTPLDEWSALRRDLYLTTHNTHNRQTSMPPVGFVPTISAGERPQTYA